MEQARRGRISPFLLLIFGLIFLFIRNIPFCFILPIWSHGDEIGHLDYVLKLNRGHLPQPTEQVEPSLFLLHKTFYDGRYFSDERAYNIRKIEDLGLAAHSYEAHHPPLPYILMALFQHLLVCLNVPMLLQVKILRIFCLLPISCGLVLISAGLKKANISNPVYHSPLLFIPLLAQDMFFSINTDSFSFLFSGFAVLGFIRLVENPRSCGAWALLSTGITLSLWTKVSNSFLFVIWVVLTLYFWVEKKDKKSILLSLKVFLITTILSSPWYVYNQMRFSNPFINSSDLPYVLLPPQSLSLPTLKNFLLAFTRTLFRGEFIWNSRYFNVLGGMVNNLVLTVLPLLIFAAGFLSFLKYFDKSKAKNLKYLILCGAGIVLILFSLHVGLGGVPYYQARFAFGGLYFIMFLYAAGWRKLARSEGPGLLIPAALLLAYNLLYAFTLAVKVL